MSSNGSKLKKRRNNKSIWMKNVLNRKITIEFQNYKLGAKIKITFPKLNVS